MDAKRKFDQVWTSDEHAYEKGPLEDQYNQLSKGFTDIRKLRRKLGSHKHNKGAFNEMSFKDGAVITPIIFGVSPLSPYEQPLTEPGVEHKFDIKGSQFQDGTLRLAIQETYDNRPNSIATRIHEYILNSSGMIIPLDEFEVLSLSRPDDLQRFLEGSVTLILKKVNEIIKKAKIEISKKAASRRKRVKKLGIASAAIPIAGALTFGGYWAWDEWINKPGIADDAKRGLYDSQGHHLPGDGVELANQQIVSIPATDFAAIPSYRSGDSLESPREFVLNGDNCVVIDFPGGIDGQTVHVVASAENLIRNYDFTAFQSDDQLSVCIPGEIDEDIRPLDRQVAIELTLNE